MKINEINWEERRFIASAIILSGICSNYSNQVVCSIDVEEAVKLSDILISQLSNIPLNNLSSDLYQREDAEL